MKFFRSKPTLYSAFLTIIHLVFIYYIISGISTAFIINNVNRSLWLDEAMLASSFTKRSLIEFLTLGKFENMQSAPLLWLFYEKFLAICFGHTEYVLRIGSISCYIFTIFLLIFIQKKFFKSKLYLLSAALFSTLQFAISYSTVFKQYISDGFIVLLIFTLYTFFTKNKISKNILRLFYCILIWASQVSCFFIGGTILTELIFSFSSKDKLNKTKLKETVITGLLVCFSFVAYYLIFASRMTSVSDMQVFWKENFFPLFPTSIKDLNKILYLSNVIFKVLPISIIYLSSFLIGGVYFSIKKEKTLISIYLGVLLTLFASFLHMYPIVDRTCFFIYPLIFLIFSLLLEDFLFKNTNNTKLKTVLTSFFLFFILQDNTGTSYYKDIKNVYWNGEEINKELVFLKEHLKNDEIVYVYKHGVPAFEFKNGYDNHSFKFQKDNVILGKNFISHTEDGDNELNKILTYQKIYIVTAHLNDFNYRFQRLLDTLHLKGYFELVYNNHNTLLWYFCKKKKNSKFNYELELVDKQKRGNIIFANIRVKNTGESYINYEYNKSFLLNKKNKNIFFLDKALAPNESTIVNVSYKANSHPSFTLRHQFGKISKRKILKNL